MQYFYKVCFYCAVLAVLLLEVSFADEENWSYEETDIRNESKLAIGDDVSEEGLPDDSHEAMNNRDTIGNPITKDRRKKRSYEFLMGLINNNSRYQVTKDEPSTSVNFAEKQDKSDGTKGDSELLLELMVKIASNPDQWNKVHQLLRQIDEDISTSKQLLEEYHNHTIEIHNLIEENQKTKSKQEEKKRKYVQEEINKEVAMSSDNGQPDLLSNYGITPTFSSTTNKEWPTFENEKINFIPNINEKTVTSVTKTYPKIFSYHRVTDKPIFVNKNPKAYVAVSVIAPKTTETHQNIDDDLELEHELRQLKPWNHVKNLKNMASIRSRWVIDSERKKT